MNKKIFFVIILLFFLSFGSASKAADCDFTQGTNEEKISCLNSIIAELTEQIVVLTAQSQTQVTATPVSTDWCYNFNSYLQRGSSSYTEVSALRTAMERESLTYTGFSGGNQTGIFNLNTKAAVMNFQEKYGIDVVGVVGPITRMKLNQLYGCSAPIRKNEIIETEPEINNEVTETEPEINNEIIETEPEINTENIRCSSNSDCGTSSFSGSSFCLLENVYRLYDTYACLNPGTTSSYCQTRTANRRTDLCSSQETCSNGECADPGQTITIVSPVTDSVWKVGETQRIQWESTGLGGRVMNISLLYTTTDSEGMYFRDYNIARVSNSGSYSWEISEDTPVCRNSCRIKIYSGLYSKKISPYFTIELASEDACIPDWQAEEEWGSCDIYGRQHRMVFDANNCATTAGRPPSYQNCNRFPDIRVLSPNSSMTKRVGENINIVWEYTRAATSTYLPEPRYVNIILRRYNPAGDGSDPFRQDESYRTLFSGVPINERVRAWTIPSTVEIGADYKILVMATNNVAYDDSDEYFKIEERISLPPVEIPVCQQLLERYNNATGSVCGQSRYDAVADFDKNQRVDGADHKIFLSGSNALFYPNGNWCQQQLNNSTSPCTIE